jgi:hypothetical protein
MLERGLTVSLGTLTRCSNNIKRSAPNPIVQVYPHPRLFLPWDFVDLNTWSSCLVGNCENRTQLVAEL